MLQCSYNLPIMLNIVLKNKICALPFMYKIAQTSHKQFRKTVLLGCIYTWQQNTLCVLLDNNCSIRVYQYFGAIYQKLFPIMVA